MKDFEYKQLIAMSYVPEMRDLANTLLYFEAVEEYEKCVELRDYFTVTAYEWCQNLLQVDMIDSTDYKSMMEIFEECFDMELTDVRNKYFQ